MSSPSTIAHDRSIAALTGASQQLFPDVGYNGLQERFVFNCGNANIAINLFGNAAALNTAGSVNIPANGSWSGKITNAITVIGTAGQPVTAGER